MWNRMVFPWNEPFNVKPVQTSAKKLLLHVGVADTVKADYTISNVKHQFIMLQRVRIIGYSGSDYSRSVTGNPHSSCRPASRYADIILCIYYFIIAGKFVTDILKTAQYDGAGDL